MFHVCDVIDSTACIEKNHTALPLIGRHVLSTTSYWSQGQPKTWQCQLRINSGQVTVTLTATTTEGISLC